MTKACDPHGGWFLRCCSKYTLACMANLDLAGFLENGDVVEKSSNETNSFLKQDDFE